MKKKQSLIRYVLFFLLLFATTVQSFAQITRERVEDDGFVYYKTIDNSKEDYSSRRGVQNADGKQIVPNEFLSVDARFGGKYFTATKNVSDNLYYDALYDDNGRCIIPCTKNWTILFFNDNAQRGYVLINKKSGENERFGACSLYTGELLLAPMYDLITYDDGVVFGKNKVNDEFEVVAKRTIPKKSSDYAHRTDSRSSSPTTTTSSNSQQGTIRGVQCMRCIGTGYISVQNPFTGMWQSSKCPDCDKGYLRPSTVPMNSNNGNVGGGSYGSGNGQRPVNTRNKDCFKCNKTGRYTCPCHSVATFGQTRYHNCDNCGQQHQVGTRHSCRCNDCGGDGKK